MLQVKRSTPNLQCRCRMISLNCSVDLDLVKVKVTIIFKQDRVLSFNFGKMFIWAVTYIFFFLLMTFQSLQGKKASVCCLIFFF